MNKIEKAKLTGKAKLEVKAAEGNCPNCGHDNMEGVVNEYGDFQCNECEEHADNNGY